MYSTTIKIFGENVIKVDINGLLSKVIRLDCCPDSGY